MVTFPYNLRCDICFQLNLVLFSQFIKRFNDSIGQFTDVQFLYVAYLVTGFHTAEVNNFLYQAIESFGI